MHARLDASADHVSHVELLDLVEVIHYLLLFAGLARRQGLSRSRNRGLTSLLENLRVLLGLVEDLLNGLSIDVLLGGHRSLLLLLQLLLPIAELPTRGECPRTLQELVGKLEVADDVCD